MFYNYIKTAIRRLLRNKSITAINIVGLSLGMAVTFVILVFIFHELSYDRYHSKKDRVYRVIQENKMVDMAMTHTPYPMARVLEEEFPEVEKTAKVFLLFDTQVRKDQEYFDESNFFCADNSLFDILTLPLLKGDAEAILKNPNEVVLTESMARKYFGSLNVLGRTLVIRNAGDELHLTVSGIMKDIPSNSTFKPDFLSSINLSLLQFNKLIKSTNKTALTREYIRNSWENGFYMTYVLTKEPVNPGDFDNKLKELGQKYLEEPKQKFYYLQPLEDIYFHSAGIFSQLNVKGDITEVYIFGFIAFLVLMIACINYILLSTSQTISRSLEIGIRKINGAGSRYLFRQVFVESLLVTLLAFPLSLILIEQFRPLLVQFLGKDFLQHLMMDWKMLLSFMLVIFIISYLPGLFTARYFSRIRPVSVFSGLNSNVLSMGKGQKGLIVVQFVIFLVLVSFSFGINEQIRYARHKDQGFDPSNIIVLPIADNPSLRSGFAAFRTALLKHNQIQDVSAAMWIPPTQSKMGMEISKPNKPEEKVSIEGLYVDKHFVETMGLHVIQGSSLSKYGGDADGMILVNEAAIKKLELDQPIGQKLGPGKVVGVMKDFHFHSFRQRIPPMMLIVGNHMARHAIIKISGKDTRSVLSYIQKQYNKFSGPVTFSYSFLNERFNKIYHSERKLGLLIIIFALIAIIIASMGLLGLTLFSTKRRMKEVAIRKINGAQIGQIMQRLSGSYVKLLWIASIIAIPVAYWILQNWLQHFAYQTNLAWWIFVSPLILALFITLSTVSLLTYRAASANPVDSLRYE